MFIHIQFAPDFCDRAGARISVQIGAMVNVCCRQADWAPRQAALVRLCFAYILVVVAVRIIAFPCMFRKEYALVSTRC